MGCSRKQILGLMLILGLTACPGGGNTQTPPTPLGTPDWVVTNLNSQSQVYGGSVNQPQGDFRLTSSMNNLRFVFASRNGDQLLYRPQGSFTITSQSAPPNPTDGCTTRLEPATMTVQFTNDSDSHLTISDPNNPSLASTPGDYEAFVVGHWTANVIREGQNCRNIYPDQVPFSMILLATGTAGFAKITPKITTLSGQFVLDDETWEWSMTAQEPGK